MRYRLLTFIFISTFLFAGANAQSNKFALKNQIEFGGSFGFVSTTPVTNGNSEDSYYEISFYPSFGWFPVNGLELGALIELKYENPSSGHSTTDYSFYFSPSYNFNTNSIIYPYLQGQIGYSGISGTTDASGVAWGFEGGTKIQILSRALLKAGLNYKQVTRNPDNSDGRNGYNDVSFLAGFMLFFNL
ncbi:MAG: hypothetical protein L0Y76_01255 [Ignavibacteria bacterium]|nr:hypothetical protein [Ignavibacteria bacterium]